MFEYKIVLGTCGSIIANYYKLTFNFKAYLNVLRHKVRLWIVFYLLATNCKFVRNSLVVRLARHFKF